MSENDRSADRRTLLKLAALAGMVAPAGVAVAQEDDDDDDDRTTGRRTTTRRRTTRTRTTERRTEDDDRDDDDDDDGLITVPGGDTVASTVACLESAIGNSNLRLITTVDHAANAASAGLDLPPTTLLIFGNPTVGTPLMQASRTVGIDLPQKLLVWEDETGAVQVTYNDPRYLADRHDVEGQDDRLRGIESALSGLATSCRDA